jgi:hypothetical protein
VRSLIMPHQQLAHQQPRPASRSQRESLQPAARRADDTEAPVCRLARTGGFVAEYPTTSREVGGFDSAYDEGVISQVLRPSAIVPEEAGRAILVALSVNSVHAEGTWLAEPSRWNLYDRSWTSIDEPGDANLIGTVQVAYGTPTRYEITIYRVTITRLGSSLNWTVESLCDAALSFGDLSLAKCPRAPLSSPPRPFRPLRGGLFSRRKPQAAEGRRAQRG